MARALRHPGEWDRLPRLQLGGPFPPGAAARMLKEPSSSLSSAEETGPLFHSFVHSFVLRMAHGLIQPSPNTKPTCCCPPCNAPPPWSRELCGACRQSAASLAFAKRPHRKHPAPTVRKMLCQELQGGSGWGAAHGSNRNAGRTRRMTRGGGHRGAWAPEPGDRPAVREQGRIMSGRASGAPTQPFQRGPRPTPLQRSPEGGV